MNKDIACLKCCDLLPDYEWLDIENRKIVDSHAEGCEICRNKKNLILGRFPQEKMGGIDMIDKIDFTNDIMKAVSIEKKAETSHFLYRLLGILAVLELLVVYWSGFSEFQETFSFIEEFYQWGSGVTFPVLDESLGLFEISNYLVIPMESLPENFMAMLFFTGVVIAAALFFVSRKRSTSYGS